jgi:hypothetical protein
MAGTAKTSISPILSARRGVKSPFYQLRPTGEIALISTITPHNQDSWGIRF